MGQRYPLLWNRLEVDLANEAENVKQCLALRRNRALGWPHYLANISDHRFLGKGLSNEQRNIDLAELVPDFLPFVTKFLTQSSFFPNYLFALQMKETSPLEW